MRGGHGGRAGRSHGWDGTVYDIEDFDLFPDVEDEDGLDEDAIATRAANKVMAQMSLSNGQSVLGDDEYDQGYRDAFRGDSTKYDSGSASASYKKGYETGEHDSQ